MLVADNQANLFERENKNLSFKTLPEGLAYIPDFIDKESESYLISEIDKQTWLYDLKRRVQHYGYRYDYKARNISIDSKLGKIPVCLFEYCIKLKNLEIFKTIPDQVIVNEYNPGQGILPHIDCVPCFGDTIASLSLNSACVMNFIHQETSEKISLILEPRSLIILSKEARYQWKHGIANRKTDSYLDIRIIRKRRISLTFRNVII